jgi:hypothetical protein
MPNALEELGRYTVLNDRTHEVHCSFNTHYVGCATYAIKHINSGRVRWMHLPARKFGYLWNSWNLIGMSKPITSKQLKEAQKRAMGESPDLKELGERTRDTYGKRDSVQV